MNTPIWIQMYHNNPPARLLSEQGHSPVWCHHSWDPYFATNVMQATGVLGPNDGWSPESLAPIMRDVVADKDMPNTLDADMNVYKLLGSREQMIALADLWADEAIKDCASVGGDDTYFDYYPDYLNGLEQLCRQIDYPAAINRAVDHARATTYANDDEGTLDGYRIPINS